MTFFILCWFWGAVAGGGGVLFLKTLVSLYLDESLTLSLLSFPTSPHPRWRI